MKGEPLVFKIHFERVKNDFQIEGKLFQKQNIRDEFGLKDYERICCFFYLIVKTISLLNS